MYMPVKDGFIVYYLKKQTLFLPDNDIDNLSSQDSLAYKLRTNSINVCSFY